MAPPGAGVKTDPQRTLHGKRKHMKHLFPTPLEGHFR
jgi:hypothetical protein